MTVLIVGADSGIGNALIKAIPHSIGTSRRNGSGFIRLDVTDQTSYPVFDKKFDEIYYCVGVGGKRETIEEVIDVNAIKSIETLKHLCQFVKQNGNIRILSSLAGSLSNSVTLPTDRINVAYKISKAALNIGVIRLHHEFPQVNWQLIHPGLVRTRLTSGVVTNGTNLRMLSPEESAEKIIKTPVKSRLSFVNVVTGENIPW